MTIKCPECKQTNTEDFWDSNTREEQGIDDKSTFISSGADKKEHEEVESYFNCPICNEEVKGVDLIKEG